MVYQIVINILHTLRNQDTSLIKKKKKTFSFSLTAAEICRQPWSAKEKSNCIGLYI